MPSCIATGVPDEFEKGDNVGVLVFIVLFDENVGIVVFIVTFSDNVGIPVVEVIFWATLGRATVGDVGWEGVPARWGALVGPDKPIAGDNEGDGDGFCSFSLWDVVFASAVNEITDARIVRKGLNINFSGGKYSLPSFFFLLLPF